jgi:hypothetical protein
MRKSVKKTYDTYQEILQLETALLPSLLLHCQDQFEKVQYVAPFIMRMNKQ